VARDIRAFGAVLDGHRVHYHLADHVGRHSRTHGKKIDIHDSRSRESVLAALQLSAQKWGTISVHGNREFMRICVELAAEHGFKIANPDLQEAIAAQRQRLRPPNGPGPRPPGVGPRPESLAPASIYRRHIEEIRRDRPRARRMDASRSMPMWRFGWL
jgi:hypothetical protein